MERKLERIPEFTLRRVVAVLTLVLGVSMFLRMDC